MNYFIVGIRQNFLFKFKIRKHNTKFIISVNTFILKKNVYQNNKLNFYSVHNRVTNYVKNRVSVKSVFCLFSQLFKKVRFFI